MEKQVRVQVYDDSHDEDPETLGLHLRLRLGDVRLADGVAIDTIINSDPMPAAWLSRFGRTVAVRTWGMSGAIAGQSLSFGPDAVGPSLALTACDVLVGASFDLTSQPDDGCGNMALWGRGALGNFDGREGTFSLNGQVTPPSWWGRTMGGATGWWASH